MIKAVFFDIGGTVHTQDATPESDRDYIRRLWCFLHMNHIYTAETPEQLLEHINAGAKAYKSYTEQELIELPPDMIWQKFFLKDFDIPAEKLAGLGEELCYMFDRYRKHIVKREGLKETLEALRQRGYRLGVISNPLFIYGGAGLGKTHLMHSIAHYIIEHDENSKVLYVTSEEFTNELIETIRNGNNSAMSKFREKYRNIDVLLVDDIQFIIGKESTQEEFFHTFNSLHSAKKQIIISSDKPPKDMEILEERFRSRFEWGLIADITLPDYETRMAILHKKEELEGYNISEEVINYIATNIKSNIRELEGAFNKVMASSKLEKKEVTLELAEQALKDIISPNEQKVITPDYIISVVAEHYHVTVTELCGNKRSSKIVMPRQIAMYLCREILDTSLKTIGKNLGNRDHTTVMHGIEKIENELKTNENLKNSIDILKKKINPQG